MPFSWHIVSHMTFACSGILIFLPDWNLYNQVIAYPVSHRVNTHHYTHLTFALVCEKTITEINTFSYIWRRFTGWCTGSIALWALYSCAYFLGWQCANDNNNLFSRCAKFIALDCDVFWMPLEEQETKNCRKKLALCHQLKIQSDGNRRWLLRTCRQTMDGFLLKWQLSWVSTVLLQHKMDRCLWCPNS